MASSYLSTESDQVTNNKCVVQRTSVGRTEATIQAISEEIKEWKNWQLLAKWK